MSDRPRVGVHANSFPVPSEVFIIEQARTLMRFEAAFLVRKQLKSTPGLDCRAIESGGHGRLRRLGFSLLPGAWAWGGACALKDIALIHAHFGPNGVYALPVASTLRVPLVVTFHGFDATAHPSHLLRHGGMFGLRYVLGTPRLKREGTRFVAVSKFIQEALIARGFPGDRIRQHYIGVDPERFTPLDPTQRTLDVVCVARLVDAKGVAVLLRAFATIANRFPESKLRLVGEGPDRPAFEKLVLELGLVGRVVFEGTMPHAEVAALVRRSAVSALVSMRGSSGWQEAFGLASIEAAAAGLPVVVSDNGGLPETVEEGVTGVVVPEGSATELSGRLAELLADGALRTKMGNAGRERVIRSFDLRRQTAALEGIYDEALE